MSFITIRRKPRLMLETYNDEPVKKVSLNDPAVYKKGFDTTKQKFIAVAGNVEKAYHSTPVQVAKRRFVNWVNTSPFNERNMR